MKRIMAVSVIGLSLMMVTVSSALASDGSARANSMFVEAVKLIQSSQNTLHNEDKLALLDKALGKLNEIIDSYPSSDLAVKLITGQSIGNMNLETVAKTAKKLRDSVEREKGVCNEAPTTKCILAFALAEAKTIENDNNRSHVLSGIAVAQAKAGDIEAAFVTAKTIEEDSERSRALSGIAVTQAKAGDIKASQSTFTLALSSAEAVKSDFMRSWALRRVAVAQAKAGDIEAAFATAEMIEKRFSSLEALRGIAEAQAEADDIKAAFTTAKMIKGGRIGALIRSSALSGIAVTLNGMRSE